MPAFESAAVSQRLLSVLCEAVEGPSGSGGYFLYAGTGLLQTLSGLNLERAFQIVAPGRPSIAQHVAHVSYHMRAVNAWGRGHREKLDWPSSWIVPEASQAVWDGLLEGLRRDYDGLCAALSNLLTTEEFVGNAAGSIAHAAYHLGAIRQLALMQETPS